MKGAFLFDSGVLVEIERRVLLENRVSQLEIFANNTEPELIQLAQLKQEKADIEQAIAELSILIAGGGV